MFQEEEEIEEAEEAQVEDSEEGGVRILIISQVHKPKINYFVQVSSVVSSTEQQASRGRSLNRRAPIVWDTGAGGVSILKGEYLISRNIQSIPMNSYRNNPFLEGHHKHQPSTDASQRGSCCGMSRSLQHLLINLSFVCVLNFDVLNLQ